ncbi:MGMT family protein [Luxibacter massiliensis]|uniref:MGMT family protein n=1 Tax=Luxibacter massiliensis TaxID=2219695 RepID=UPI000F04BD0C|nr:MGMT family protein [Luxibacter massiliensis]
MDFYKRMELVCRQIPWGKAATYGQIALLCGRPGNARQVGYALRKDLAGAGVPAHRIVNVRGILSGAAAFEEPGLQRRLLESEGIEIVLTKKGWQIDISRDGWKNTMEEALILREEFEKRGI